MSIYIPHDEEQDQAFIISEQPVSNGKSPKEWLNYLLIGACIIILAVGLTASIFVVRQSTTAFTRAQQKNEKAIKEVLDDTVPSTSFGGIAKVEAREYQNPFEKQTTYKNPYDELNNPFDVIPK